MEKNALGGGNMDDPESLLKLQLAVIKAYDQSRGFYPPVPKAEIAKKFGINKNRVTRILKNREGILRRSAAIKNNTVNSGQDNHPASAHIVLAIPDKHHPFAHPDALAFLKEVKAKYQPTKIVCLGDEIDAHAFSKYPKDPDGLAPGLEITRAREALIPFYLEFPEMLVCHSNHTVRPWKRAFEQGLPASFLPTYAKFLNAPDGWAWADSWCIDDVLYIHGEGKAGFNAHVQWMRAYKRSVVIGHIHSYAAVSHEGNLFAVNAGCLIDADAYCFKYAKGMPIPVNLGCAIIHRGQRAEFIPMHLDSHKRWTGKL